MKIHALMTTFNCVETIENALDSLVDKVDDIIIFDGRWEGFEGSSDSSGDGTIEKIEEFSKNHPDFIRLFIADKPFHQVAARQFLVSQVPDGDWILVMDSDEILKNWINIKEILTLFPNLKAARICANLKPLVPMETPRFFKKTPSLHYESNHRFLSDNDGKIFMSGMPLLKILIVHHEKSKDKSMRKSMEKYKVYLRNWENEQAENWQT